MPSDVQVFVRFKDQCIFAGEELSCVISFKNVAEQLDAPGLVSGTYRHTKRNSINQLAVARTATAHHVRDAREPRQQDTRSPSIGPGDHSQVKHQTSLSISTPVTPALRGPSPSNDTVPRPAHQHQRSVSIISASPVVPQDAKSTRPILGVHRRSSTMTSAGKC